MKAAKKRLFYLHESVLLLRRTAGRGEEGRKGPTASLSLHKWVKHAEPHFSSLSLRTRGALLCSRIAVCGELAVLSPPLLGSDSLPVSSSVERQRRSPPPPATRLEIWGLLLPHPPTPTFRPPKKFRRNGSIKKIMAERKLFPFLFPEILFFFALVFYLDGICTLLLEFFFASRVCDVS